LRGKTSELLCHLHEDLPHLLCFSEHHLSQYIHTFHGSMTSPQGAFGYETLSVDKGMITKISCHNTQNDIQQDNTQTYLHKTDTLKNIKQYNI